MSSYTEAELDAMFEDTQEDTSPSLRPLTTFDLFMSFPAELRDMVYTEYFSEHLDNQPFKINEHGCFKAPSLLSASKQLLQETWRHWNNWCNVAICNPAVQIEAQIRDFDNRRLQNRLNKMSRDSTVPMQQLAIRTKVTFIGKMNFGNIMSWITDHISDPTSTPVFEQSSKQAAQLIDAAATHLLAGPTSLVDVVRRYRTASNQAAWKRQGLTFLELSDELGVDVGRYDKAADPENIAQRIFEVLADWHFEMMRRPGNKCNAVCGKKRRRVERDAGDMAQLVYALCLGIL